VKGAGAGGRGRENLSISRTIATISKCNLTIEVPLHARQPELPKERSLLAKVASSWST